MKVNCQKEEWRGRCCCTCQYQVLVTKHPWNTGFGQGRITERLGFGCAPTEFYDTKGEFAYKQIVTFFDEDHQHGLCEMHRYKDE